MFVAKTDKDFLAEAVCPNAHMCKLKIRKCSECPSKDIWNTNMWREETASTTKSTVPVS